jgi:hypothetical protein
MSISDRIIQAIKNGAKGGFAAKLAEAYQTADHSNQRKIEEAFPDIFQQLAQGWLVGLFVEEAPTGWYWARHSGGSVQVIRFDEGTKKIEVVGIAGSGLLDNEWTHFYGPIYSPAYLRKE